MNAKQHKAQVNTMEIDSLFRLVRRVLILWRIAKWDRVERWAVRNMYTAGAQHAAQRIRDIERQL